MAIPVDNSGRYNIVAPPGPWDAATKARINKQSGLIQQKLDPYNWAAIAAAQKQNNIQTAAQNKIKSQAKVNQKPSSGGAAAPAAPPASMKELLDAYRAYNNGALPPGTSPELAALIDQGLWTNEMAAANPGLVQSLIAVQQQITGVPALYDEGIAAVKSNYENLTGDVLSSGKNMMQDILGRMVDPNDPNAALVNQDPALTQYAQSMSQIDETADTNEATDLAWFEKMKANSQQNYQNLLLGLATGAFGTGEEDGSGGGGGGGGGRRGRGRGGGSGGDSDWGKPKTTSTRTDQLATTATDKYMGYFPGFHEAIIEAAGGNPETAALYQDLFDQFGGRPVEMAKGLQSERTAGEAKLQELAAQGLYRQGWQSSLPASMEQSVADMRNILGYVYQDDPEHNPKGNENVARWYVPKERRTANEQQVFDAPTQAKIQLGKDIDSKKAAALLLEGLAKSGKFGVSKNQGRLLAAQYRDQANIAQREADKQKYVEAKMNATSDLPFNIKDWAAGGGYVPAVDKEEEANVQDRLNAVYNLSGVVSEWNPQINAQQISTGVSDVGKQSDVLKTTQSTKNPDMAVGGNLQDVMPERPEGTYSPSTQFLYNQHSPISPYNAQPIVPGPVSPSYDYTSTDINEIGAEDPNANAAFGFSRGLSRAANARLAELSGLLKPPTKYVKPNQEDKAAQLALRPGNKPAVAVKGKVKAKTPVNLPPTVIGQPSVGSGKNVLTAGLNTVQKMYEEKSKTKPSTKPKAKVSAKDQKKVNTVKKAAKKLIKF
jgi:hypothetical protein